MEELKEILKNPALFETKMKEAWDQIDTKKEGEVSFEAFKAALEQLTKQQKIVEMLPTTDEGREIFKKVTDPNNTGKVNYEGFKNITLKGIEKMKKAGKL